MYTAYISVIIFVSASNYRAETQAHTMSMTYRRFQRHFLAINPVKFDLNF